MTTLNMDSTIPAGNYRTATAHIITAVIGSGVLALGYAVGTVRTLYALGKALQPLKVVQA